MLDLSKEDAAVQNQMSGAVTAEQKLALVQTLTSQLNNIAMRAIEIHRGSQRAIPDSVREFTDMYLTHIDEIISSL